jgi:23S rRNA (uracil1939-C5)-methyltransferase
MHGLTSTDEIELELDGMAQGGEAVGRWQGRVVFAAGGLPGERVRVRVGPRKARYLRGVVSEVLHAAPERISPRLPGADHIPWQYIDYAAQLRFKQSILRDQLARLAQIDDPPVAAVLPAAQPWGYRNTAHLHIEAGQVGYHAAGSRMLQPLDEDPLLLPALNEALAGLHPLLAEGDRAAPLEAVTLRASAAYGYAVAWLHAHGPLPNLGNRWQARVPALAAASATSGVTLHDELGGIVFVLTPASFFQVHAAQAATLLGIVREMLELEPRHRLLDAYSGVGTFALPLAGSVREVLAIEGHPQAVHDGEQSARLNEVANVQFLQAPVERALPDIAEPFAAAILDPPRRGCHPAALAALARLAPSRIAYVSCQPAVLARDVRQLLDAGYTLQAVQPVDMFPQTPHIECVALLVQGSEQDE